MFPKAISNVMKVVCACLAVTGIANGASAPSARTSNTPPSAADKRVPLYFESNRGQMAGEVQFLARASGYNAYLTGDEAVLEYQGKVTADVHLKLLGALKPEGVRGEERLSGVVNYLTGSNPSQWHIQIPTFAAVRYAQVYPGIDMVYRGEGKQLEFEFDLAAGADPKQIRLDISGAKRVIQSGDGDLQLDTGAGPASILSPIAYQLSNGRRELVEASFQIISKGVVEFKLGAYDHSKPLIIDPTVGVSTGFATYFGSGNPSGDRFTSMAVDSTGAVYLCGYTSNTNFPTASAYQTANRYTSASAGFVSKLSADGQSLVYSTYISGNTSGASQGVQLNAIAVNSSGNAFVGGLTDDSTFPTMKAFNSTFPTGRGGYNGSRYSITTGVVLELAANGSSLVFSSFLGGGDSDSVLAIALDSSSNVYATGSNSVSYTDPSGNMLTTSAFPVTSGVVWGHFNQANSNIGSGFGNSFASRIAPPSSGNAALSYSTIIGCNFMVSQVYGHGVAVDSSNNAYFAGTANCNIGDHGGPYSGTNMSHVSPPPESEYLNNVWVLKLNSTATSVGYLDYLGGSTPSGTYSPSTSATGIQVDSGGKAYIAGTTQANNFQTTSGAYQTTRQLAGITSSYTGSTQSDAFLTILTSTGGISYSTYLNGNTLSPQAISDDNSALNDPNNGSAYADGTPSIGGIALDANGNVVLAGTTATSNFPNSIGSVSSPMLSTYTACTLTGICTDYYGFLTKFTSSGSLYYSALFGEGTENSVNGLAANGTDTFLLVSEAGNGLATNNAYDPSNSSGAKAFVVKLGDVSGAATTVTLNPVSVSYSVSDQTIALSSTVSSSSTVPGGTVTYTVRNGSGTVIGSAVTSGAVSSGATPSVNYTLPGATVAGSYTITAAYGGTSGYASSTGTATLTVSSLLAQATLTVTGAPSSEPYGLTFTVSSSGGSGSGAVTYTASGACSSSSATMTMTSGTGICSVTATKAADSTYQSATSASATVSATSATQAALTVTGVPGTAQVYNTSFTVSSTGGSGTGAVTFSATGACSVSGATVTMTSANGTCTVTATKATDSNYSATTSAASVVSATQAAQSALTVTGVPGTARAYNVSFTVGSSGGSGTGAITFNATGVCSLSGSTVTMTSGTGSCSITATKAADSNYTSATSAASAVNAALASQPSISVTGVPGTAQAYNNSFPVGSSGGSGTGALSFNAIGSCSVSGSTVTMTSATGTCSVIATKAADSNYSSASSAAATVNAALATQSALAATGVPVTAQGYNSSFTVSSTGGSGTGAVTFSATGACSVSGATVTMTSANGTCTVTATKASDGHYASTTSVVSTVSASFGTQSALTVTGVPGTAQVYNNSFTVSSSGGSGTGAVTFNATGACTLFGSTVTMTSGTGTCSVTATKASDEAYAAATSALVSVAAAMATQTVAVIVTGFPNTAQTYSSNFTAGSSGGNGSGAVTFNANGACSASGTTITMTSGSGTCSVTASKASDGHYVAQTSAAVTVSAALASQAITFAPLASPVTYLSPIALTATGGGSTKPVVFSIVSGPGAISSNTLILTGLGTVVVAANQDGDANYARASQVTQSVVSLASNLTFNNTHFVFGGVPLGSTSPTQTLIVSNPNGFAVTNVSIVASTDFSATSNCPTIAALGTCSVNITFTPSSAGTHTGNLTVTDAQSNGQLSASLTGTGAAAGIQFTTASLNFGGGVINTSSVGQTFTIQNTGTANLVISNIATTGDFTTTGNCATIPAGSNCSITVTFTPTVAGARTGTVTLTDNAGGSSQTDAVNLSGLGTQAGATLTPGVQTFPSTLVGSSSFLLNATLTNTGTAPLTGIGVSILGDFTDSSTCPGSLGPDQSCIISVTYVPTVVGTESGTLTVTENLGTQIVSLVGTGVLPGAALSNSQIMFGGQLVSTSSRAQTVVFTNTGSAAVNIASVVTTSSFTDTTNCSGSVAAGASCSVNVTFTPNRSGSLSGTVTITDGAGTQAVSLQGQGVSPGLAVSPSFEIFGAQVAGTTSQAQTLTVTNTGTVALTLNPVTVSNNLIESDQCPAIFQPGATCHISLSFSPTSTGTLAGSLVIGDVSGLASTLVTTTGQGTLPGISTSPSTLSFGSLPVGTTSHGQTVTVTNSGTAPLQIGTVSGTGDFAETDTCSSQAIPVGGYCVISITMTPTTVGTRTGAIQFNNSADGQHQIALSGVGQQPGVSVSPTSLAFGSAPIVSSVQASGAAGTSLSVSISNTGSAPLALGGFATQGDFSEADNCGASVAVGATCALTVKFAPTALGHRTGTLTITDNAGGGSQTVSLAGDGSPAGLILTPPLIDFGVQPKDATSKAHTATLSNNTGQAIANLLILASGEYSETDDCGKTLANSATCTLNITVTPATTGAITGTVVISGGGVFTATAPSVRTRAQSANNAAVASTSDLGVVATLAETNGNANATASELAFGSTPTPVITAGSNAGSSITAQENDSNGNAVSGTDSITLTVTLPSGITKTYTAIASGGQATFNLSGNPLTAAGVYSYTVTAATNASIKAATASETVVAGAATSVTATAGSGQSALTNASFATPLQVIVKDAYGNPVSGATVTFAAPATGASATLSSSSVKTGVTGTANITATANGTAGTYTVSAAASGATLTSFSLTNSQVLSNVDFSLNPGNITGEGPSQTVIPGGTATYALAIVPTSGTTLPASTTLTISGMPAGATATVLTSPWTQLTANSWSFPANTSFTGLPLTIQLPSATAHLDNKDEPMRKIPPVLWGILLLPFAGRMRRIGKRLGKTACLLMLMVVGMTAAAALSGCGSSNGFFGQAQKTYTVTVTATSGTLSHSTNLTLTVE